MTTNFALKLPAQQLKVSIYMKDTGGASFRIYLLPENSGDKTKNGCLFDFAQRSNATHVQAFITFREYIYETFVGHHFVSENQKIPYE